MSKPRTAFTVGWICALGHELTACRGMLDEEYEAFEDQDRHDDNVYHLGRVGKHDVVIACLPGGKMGKASAALVATNLTRSFPSVRFGLMVGIGGAVPDSEDIRLGDVVVSRPTEEYGGVLQYDLGKVLPDGGFKVRGHLNQPPMLLLNATHSLQSNHARKGHRILELMTEWFQREPRLRRDYEYPGADNDHLYEDKCEHDKEIGCKECDGAREIIRPTRFDWEGKPDLAPRIFYGLIGSGDRVIASSQERGRLKHDANVLCFEMEAAGLMNSFPCLVIRGMSDYADARKRDEWQNYAAGTAAAYAKELLLTVPTYKVEHMEHAKAATGQ